MQKNDRKLRIGFNSPVILAFAGLCLLSYLLNLITVGGSNELLFETYRSSLLNPLTYVRAFTHILGHASWEHLFSNMMYILLLGPILEEKYGSLNVLFVMLSTALVTSVVNAVFFPYTALLGASGVAFAFILLSSITNFREREIPLTFLLVAAMYIGEQVYQAVAFRDNVSQMGHIVGGVMGSLLGFVMSRNRMSRYQR